MDSVETVQVDSSFAVELLVSVLELITRVPQEISPYTKVKLSSVLFYPIEWHTLVLPQMVKKR